MSKKRSLNSIKTSFAVTFLSFAVSALGILMIPLLDVMPESAGNIISKLIAVVIWSSVVVGIASIVITDVLCSKWRRWLAASGVHSSQKVPGIIKFSKKKSHLALYAACVIGIVLLVTDIVFRYLRGYITFPIISIVILTFVLHSITDGKNYKLYKTIKKGVRGYEK